MLFNHHTKRIWASYSKLPFENHLNMVTTKINKIIGLLRKLQNLLPRTALYKSFVRPHLDGFNLLIHQKLECIMHV